MTPDSNHVNIRLEISVPVGVNVQLGQGGGGLPQLPGLLKLFFDTAGDPATGLAFSAPIPNICVRPTAGSALGSIAIFFTYSTAPAAVKAINYPLALDHADANPPVGAVLGTPSVGNTVWTWNTLCNADHAQSPNTTQNVVRLWTQATSSSPFVADAMTFHFYGYSGSGSPCGNMSGSGALFAGGTLHQPDLQLQVLDGPKAGRYRAKAVGSLRWEVAIAGTVYSIRMTADEATAFFSCPSSTVMSKSAGKRPFYAIFPGSLIGTANDVVAFQE